MTRYLKNTLRLTLALMVLLTMTANAQFWSTKKTELLPETEAFGMTAFIDGDQLRIQWSIAEDYYMYREQFKVSSITPGAEFGDLVFPQGVIEQDPEFGEVEVYFYKRRIERTDHKSAEYWKRTTAGNPRARLQ